MIQNIIFISIYFGIILYFYKKKIFGSSLLFLYSGIELLISIFFIEDQLLRKFLSNQMTCNLLILLGFLLIKKGNTDFKRKYTIVDPNVLKTIFLIFSLFIFYHWYMIGIPYFSENIHTLRFNLRTSGFFGLPSRLAVYGITVLFILTLLSYEKDILKKERLYIYFLIIFIFTSFQSSKSSLLPIFYYLVLCYPLIQIKRATIYTYRNFIFSIILIYGYFILTFGQIGTIDNLGILDYLILRSTVITYDSGIFLLYKMPENHFFFVFNNAILNDLLYPIFTLFTSEVTTLNEQLSRAMYGNYTGLSVPVTPGWFAYHNFIFRYSVSLTYVYSLIFGLLIGFLDNKVFNSNSLLTQVALITSLYWLWTGYSKGNLYYIILNLLGSLAVVYMINIFFKKKVR